MNKLITKARSGVTLVELLVVILIVTILSVSLLPLLKPYIEQSKYAAEVQPTLANVQTKINLYQYEKDKLPCTVATTVNGVTTEDNSSYDNTDYTWMLEETQDIEKTRKYKAATRQALNTPSDASDAGTQRHLTHEIDVDWQDLLGKRINPSQFRYHLLKGSGAAKYGYAVGIFGDGDGIAKGTGYAILVLVDTESKVKVIATWERYKPKKDSVVYFNAKDSGELLDDECRIPLANTIANASSTSWGTILSNLKAAGWVYNFSDDTSSTSGGNEE